MASPLPSFLGAPQWGLFGQDGSPVLVASSFASLDYVHDYRISTYQQEQGAFASYNKVQTPYAAKVGFLVGGPADERAAFLSQAEFVVASLNLVTIITPEIPYLNANPAHISYRRTSKNGVTLILVEIWLAEVRIISSVTTSNTASVNGSAPQQNGITQPGPTLTSQLAPPAGVTPQISIALPQQQTNSNYQFFNLSPPETQNLN